MGFAVLPAVLGELQSRSVARRGTPETAHGARPVNGILSVHPSLVVPTFQVVPTLEHEAGVSLAITHGLGGHDDGAVGPGRNAERDFRGEKRSNETHESTTDAEARLYRKGNGRESRLCFMGHALMENRNGLVVGGNVTIASGTAEREAALELIDRHCPGNRRRTLGADKAYDVTAFVDDLRSRKVTPHVTVQDHLSKTGKRRKTGIDGRTTRHPGYAISQRVRKRIEEAFGWVKVPGGQAKTRFRGQPRVEASFTLGLAADNSIRLPRLPAETAP